jgi:hypothetical protein
MDQVTNTYGGSKKADMHLGASLMFELQATSFGFNNMLSLQF